MRSNPCDPCGGGATPVPPSAHEPANACEMDARAGARAAVRERLQAQLVALEEGARARAGEPAFTLGAPALDALMPGGGVAPGLHETRPQTYGDAPACAGLVARLAVRAAHAQPGPVAWIRPRRAGAHDYGDPDPAGLAAAGLDPDRVVLIRPRDVAGALWAGEEAARTPGVALVIVEVGAHRVVDLTAQRRLELAAREAGRVVWSVRDHGPADPSPARTRWRVASAPGAAAGWRTPGDNALDGVGAPRWRVCWTRRRGLGAEVERTVEWDDATCGFGVVAAVADRPARAGPGRSDAGDVIPLRRAG